MPLNDSNIDKAREFYKKASSDPNVDKVKLACYTGPGIWKRFYICFHIPGNIASGPKRE